MIASKICGKFSSCDGVNDDIGCTIGIPPISSWANETIHCLENLLLVIALSYVEHFLTDFNQSSSCSGPRELENVGGLWLMNSCCLSLGGG